jgi:hypothetical protein
MVTSAELKAAGYKRIELGEDFTSDGKYFIQSPSTEDFFDHSIYWLTNGKIYRTTVRKLQKNKNNLGQFEYKVDQDQHRLREEEAARKDSSSVRGFK